MRRSGSVLTNGTEGRSFTGLFTLCDMNLNCPIRDGKKPFFPASLAIRLVIARQRQLNVLSVSRWTAEPAPGIIHVAVDNVPVLIVWPPAAGQDEGGGGFSSHTPESPNMADQASFSSTSIKRRTSPVYR